jgi:hypothetical protein
MQTLGREHSSTAATAVAVPGSPTCAPVGGKAAPTLKCCRTAGAAPACSAQVLRQLAMYISQCVALVNV